MMTRSLIISAAAHLAILVVFWQVSLSLSRPAPRGYPRLMTARLVAKPGGASAPAAQPEVAESKSVSAPAPALKPVEEKKAAVAPPKIRPEKTPPASKPPAAKPNVPSASGSSSATGSRGSTMPGAGGGNNALKLDAPDFPFPHYIALIQYRIESNWEAPFSGQGERLATIYFKITRSGEITDIQLENSSGNVVFDQAAKRAIYNANPLPPLPADSGLETLGVHFDFVAY